MLLASGNLIEQALDPSQVEIPPESLWMVFGTMFGFTLGGLAVLYFVVRRFGPAGGEMRRSDVVIAFPILIGVVFTHLFVVGPASVGSPLLGGLALSVLALGAIVLAGFNPWRPPDQPRSEWVGVRPMHLALTPLVWLLAVPVLITAMFAAVALAQLVDLPVTMQDRLQELRSRNDPVWIIGWYVAAAVAAPLLEEFVFRAVLLGGLMGLLNPMFKGSGWRNPGTWIALLISGSLFVLAHGVWSWTVGIIPLSALTFVLSLVYLHTRSIWPPVLLHAIHNGFVVTMQFFVLMD